MTSGSFTSRFVDLVQGSEEDLPLDEACLLIAAHARPDLDVGGQLRVLDELAAGCPEASLAAWRHHVFVELGFRGNTADYYDPDNSFLDQVVRRRLGIPISLAVVGMELGRRVGVPLQGVAMPGHFMLRHAGPTPTLLDPFDGGRQVDQQECRRRFHRGHGNDAPFLASYLEPVGHRAIVARMLANLRAVYASRGDVDGLKWVLELRGAIPGVPPQERRVVADVLAARGEFRRAAHELEVLADARPEEAEPLRAEAVRLLARLN